MPKSAMYCLLAALWGVLFMHPGTVSAQTAYLGCFKDQGDPRGTLGRDLDGDMFSKSSMTPQVCIDGCAAQDFAYAAVQYGRYCFCGNSYGKSGPADSCNVPCSGDPNETCGGKWANSVYTTGHRTPKSRDGSAPSVLPTWRDKGYPGPSDVRADDRFDARTDRPGGDYRNFPMDSADPRLCQEACTAESRCRAWTFVNSGVQGPNAWCWLKDSVPPARPASCCTSGVKPTGETAGAGDIRPTWVDPGFPGSGTVQGAGVAGGGAAGDFIGCFKDGSPRDLSGETFGINEMTIDRCMSFCAEKNYAFAGLQFGRYCFCGDAYGSHGSANNCNMACSGNANETCGGKWANSIYRTGHGSASSAGVGADGPNTGSSGTVGGIRPGSSADQGGGVTAGDAAGIGCFKDGSPRDLSGKTFGINEMTINQCTSFCAEINMHLLAFSSAGTASAATLTVAMGQPTTATWPAQVMPTKFAAGNGPTASTAQATAVRALLEWGRAGLASPGLCRAGSILTACRAAF